MAQGNARDFVYIALAIGGLFGALFLYSGAWPPVLVVETGSMMQVDRVEWYNDQGTTRGAQVSFGRIGTMDPGDLVLVKEVDSLDEVTTFAETTEKSYNRRGDVIAFQRPNNADDTPIIHRAMTYVFAEGTGPSRTYNVLWTEAWEERGECVRTPRYVCVFNATGVTIDKLGLTNKALPYSGFITKGDNGASNVNADQAGSDPLMPQPVRLEDIVGKAQGELPALGLLRLAFSGDTVRNAEMESHAYWQQVGNVVAPLDTWAVLLAELILLSLAPLFYRAIQDATAKPQRQVAPELAVLERAWEEARRGAPVPGNVPRTQPSVPDNR